MYDFDHFVLKDSVAGKSYQQVASMLSQEPYFRELGVPDVAIADGLRVMNKVCEILILRRTGYIAPGAPTALILSGRRVQWRRTRSPPVPLRP